MGYLFRISFLGYNLKSYPDYHKISYNILSYPIISFHILSYPKISSGANSQMVDETKEDILNGILLKLRAILCRFKDQIFLGNALPGLPEFHIQMLTSKRNSWAYTCNSIIREATNPVKRGKLCNFYIIWKLHKALLHQVHVSKKQL